MSKSKMIIGLVLVILIVSFFIFDIHQYLQLDYLKEKRSAWVAWKNLYPFLATAIFFLIYVIVTALSLPGAAVMTLLVGAVFGLSWGLLLVSFASTIGATLAFLFARFLLHDLVQNRYRNKLSKINHGIEKDGAFYLFGLRLVPLFPFFVINLTMGLTTIRTWTFYWVSQIGMLPGTFIYVNAGTQLGKLESASGILSPAVLLSFALLGIFPLLAKKSLQYFGKNHH